MENPKFFPISTCWDIGLIFSLVVSRRLSSFWSWAAWAGVGGVVACVRALGFNFMGVHLSLMVASETKFASLASRDRAVSHAEYDFNRISWTLMVQL